MTGGKTRLFYAKGDSEPKGRIAYYTQAKGGENEARGWDYEVQNVNTGNETLTPPGLHAGGEKPTLAAVAYTGSNGALEVRSIYL